MQDQLLEARGRAARAGRGPGLRAGSAMLLALVACRCAAPAPPPAVEAQPVPGDAAQLRTEMDRLTEEVALLRADQATLRRDLDTLRERSGRPGSAIDAPPGLAALITDLGSADIVRRYQAGRSVEELGAPAIPALLRAIEAAPHGRQAETATLVLSEMEDPAATDALVVAAHASTTNAARCASLLALARRREPRAIPLVIAGLTDPQREMRIAAAKAAERMGLLDAAGLLVEMQLAGSPEEQRVASRALARLGASAATSLARRLGAATPVEKIRLLETAESLPHEHATAVARPLLGDAAPEVRLAAAHVLAAHGSSEGLEVARALLAGASDPRTQEAARRIVEMIGPPAAASGP